MIRDEFIEKIDKAIDFIEQEHKNFIVELTKIEKNQINIIPDLPLCEGLSQNCKNIINKFWKNEESFINFYNLKISKKDFNIILIEEKIKECFNETKKISDKINNINNDIDNINKHIINNENYYNLQSLWKNYIKIFRKSTQNLIEDIKYLVSLLKDFVKHLNNIKNTIGINVKQFETIFNEGKANLDENQICFQFYLTYTNIVKCFLKYEIYISKIKNYISNKNPYEKLNSIQNEINKVINQKPLNFNIDLSPINIFDILYKNNYINDSDIEYECPTEMKFKILFIFDITSTMGKYLKLFIANYEKMYSELKLKNPLAIFYLGFIGYKDITDLKLGDEYIDIDFTLFYDEIYNKIKDIQPEGGDDIPEDVAGAFEMALKKDWNDENGTNIAILVTDAPCHGIKYHDLIQEIEMEKDNFPDENYDGLDDEYKRKKIETLVVELAKKNINLICVELNYKTKIMFNMFEEKYISENKKELFNLCEYKEKSNDNDEIQNILNEKVQVFYEKKEKEILDKIQI